MKHICDNLEKEYQVEIIEEVPNFGAVEPEYQPREDMIDHRALAGFSTG